MVDSSEEKEERCSGNQLTENSENYSHGTFTLPLLEKIKLFFPPPIPGVPKLFLAMYPFSIWIDEHVPLNMGAGSIFSREGPIMDFPGLGHKYFAGRTEVAKFHVDHSKLRKQFCIKS